MDIEVNLREQRKLAAEIIALDDGPDDDAWCADLPDKARRLAELVQAMDEWLSGGGFLPKDWRREFGSTGPR